jgi:hypothetical protein
MRKEKWLYQPCLCSPKFIQLIWYTPVSAHCKISQIQQVDIQMLLHRLILLVSPIRYRTQLLLRKEGKILFHWPVHYTILINSITHGPWEDLSQLVKKFPIPLWMLNICYSIHKNPLDAEVLNPLHSVTHLVLHSFVGQFLSWQGHQKGPSHLLFVQITFFHFSLICNILYSSPCTLKWCPLPAKCLPKHLRNHHTVLICGFAMSIQHDTSYCSTMFLMLIKVLYIYLTPPFTSGLGSLVSVATGYRLDGLGIKSRWGWDFPHLSRPALGPTQPPVQWVSGLSRGIKSSQVMTLTPHPFLVLWSRKGRAIPLLPLWVVQPVQSLSACTRVHFTFYLPFTSMDVSYYSCTVMWFWHNLDLGCLCAAYRIHTVQTLQWLGLAMSSHMIT